MPTTVRQRVLEYVHHRRRVTASQVADALQMSRANARHHLNILRQQGLLTSQYLQAEQGRGRPAQVYMLSEQILGDNLANLVHALLETIQSSFPLETASKALQEVAHQLAVHFTCQSSSQEAAGKSSLHLTQRLFKIVQILNNMHYQARWEAHQDSPRLVLGRCPYAAVQSNHPEICLVDGWFLQEILSCNIEQMGRLIPDQQGGKMCVFRVLGRA